MAVLIFNITVFGTVTFYIEKAEAVEFLELIFWVPVSLILYNASKPQFKNIFKKS